MTAREELTRSLDAIAHEYAERFCRELEGKPFDRSLLRRFAETTADGRVCDLGCGPGHVADHLAGLGGEVIGIDLSPQMVAEASARYPSIAFQVGDMLDLPLETESLSGIVALYSIIHLTQASLPLALREMHRVLRPGGILLVAFHKGDGELHTDNVFDTGASIDLRLFEPDEVTLAMEAAGFSVKETTVRRPYETEYPTQRVYILAERTPPPAGSTASIEPFLREVTGWAETNADVHAVALVGSHARREATAASDIDLVIVLRDPSEYARDTSWAQRFGQVARRKVEDYGRVTSIRVWYAEGREVEFGLTHETWLQLPLDEGTRTVVNDGMRVLFERDRLLSRCLDRGSPCDGGLVSAGGVRIATSRLVLAPLTEADAPRLLAYRSDPSVRRFQLFEPRSVDDAKRFIASASGAADTVGEWRQLGMHLRNDGLLVGDVGYCVSADQPGTVEFGITVAPEHQGEGIATEALFGLVGYLFGQLDARRVFASVDPRNAASVALMRRVGLRQEAHFRQSMWFRDEWVDDLVFAILRPEWKATSGE